MQKQTGTLHWNTWDPTAAYFLTHTHTVPKHTCTHRRRDFVGFLLPSKDPQMTWTKASSNTKPKSNLAHFKGKLLHMKTKLIRISQKQVISCSLRLTKYPGHRAINHLALFWPNTGTVPTVWATFSGKEEEVLLRACLTHRLNFKSKIRWQVKIKISLTALTFDLLSIVQSNNLHSITLTSPWFYKFPLAGARQQL